MRVVDQGVPISAPVGFKNEQAVGVKEEDDETRKKTCRLMQTVRRCC